MTREEMIQYIRKNDSRYCYEKVNFKYYTEDELKLLIDRLNDLKELNGNDARFYAPQTASMES
jgi:hypothetical protein